MEGHEILLLLPPAVAVVGAWLAARAIKKSARDIDRRRDELHVLKEREMQRTSPPVQSSAPMRPMPPA